jgi:hypothetical protein
VSKFVALHMAVKIPVKWPTGTTELSPHGIPEAWFLPINRIAIVLYKLHLNGIQDSGCAGKKVCTYSAIHSRFGHTHFDGAAVSLGIDDSKKKPLGGSSGGSQRSARHQTCSTSFCFQARSMFATNDTRFLNVPGWQG